MERNAVNIPKGFRCKRQMICDQVLMTKLHLRCSTTSNEVKNDQVKRDDSPGRDEGWMWDRDAGWGTNFPPIDL